MHEYGAFHESKNNVFSLSQTSLFCKFVYLQIFQMDMKFVRERNTRQAKQGSTDWKTNEFTKRGAAVL